MAWTSRKANITAACVTLLVFLLAIFMLLAQIDVNSPSLRLVRIDRTRSPSYHHHISTEDSRHEVIIVMFAPHSATIFLIYDIILNM